MSEQWNDDNLNDNNEYSGDNYWQSDQNGGYQSPTPPEDDHNKHKKGKKVAAIAAAAILAVGLLGGGVYAGVQYASNKSPFSSLVSGSNSSENATQGTVGTATLTKAESSANSNNTDSSGLIALDVSGIVKQVKPTVVQITNTLEYTTSGTNDPFSQFFGGQAQQQTQEAEAYGSGVIIGQNDTDLLIVTNNHVTAADDSSSDGYSFYSYSSTSKNISVTFVDGTSVDATMRGSDEAMDLAVIAVPLDQISAGTMETIKVATVGDSDACEEGNGVIAIGNALGEGFSTTVGFVSALNREVTIDNNTRTLMQTDAAINPGNSGGGLFNMAGELIGINSAKASSEEIEGIGYAIPISSAESIITTLMNETPRIEVAEAERGYLGIEGADVPTNYVTNYGFPAGTSVSKITSGSPAEQSGIQIYDIITAVNDKSVSGITELRNELNYYKAGETVTITVQRASGNSFETKQFSVTLTSKDSSTDETSTQLPSLK